jgi:ATP-dependent Clp protease ATP-binding subunit ClpA
MNLPQIDSILKQYSFLGDEIENVENYLAQMTKNGENPLDALMKGQLPPFMSGGEPEEDESDDDNDDSDSLIDEDEEDDILLELLSHDGEDEIGISSSGDGNEEESDSFPDSEGLAVIDSEDDFAGETDGIGSLEIILDADEQEDNSGNNDENPGKNFFETFFGNAFERGGAKYSDDEDEKSGRRKNKKPKKNKRQYLDTYCTNLTQRAAGGQLDNVIGREREIERMVQILSRRTKNNPCLIGEPGVGKTAVVEGLALKIAQGSVPARLQDKEVHMLDLTALVAGTQFRGQFESRIKGLVDEVKAQGNIILFIDELHNLVGTGDSEGTMNAANILKPALSRGEIHVVGATTFNEYRKHIEKDSALERRFQSITVNEPTIDETFMILKGIKGYYEKHHRIILPDDILLRAVNMSERYITDRFLPDKAIDLIDEASACASLRNKAMAEYDLLLDKIKRLHYLDERLSDKSSKNAISQEDYYKKHAELQVSILQNEERQLAIKDEALGSKVTEYDLAKVVELWTGINAMRVQESEFGRLSSLEQSIEKRIKGQHEAVELVAAAIRRNRVQISPRRRPSSFIFVGPTGVGKTELVKVLSEELFDSPETLIRLDMSEYMEKHSVSKIIGSPPGYVGYSEAGQLTEKVRRKPYSVLLFDEIEKAHPDVLNILLQILDEGKITDAQGRVVNFENTLLVMTSNAGSDRRDSSIGFAKSESDISREKAMKALGEFLRPEFLARVDEVVVFNPLSEAALLDIAKLMLGEYVTPMKERGVELILEDSAAAAVVEKADGGKNSARDLRNYIRREVEDKIARLIIDRMENLPPKIVVFAKDGVIGIESVETA